MSDAVLSLKAKASEIVWETTPGLVPYLDAVHRMETLVDQISSGAQHPQKIWLLEHPPLYTSGTSAQASEDLRLSLDDLPFPLHETGRGGKITYHGPGQRIIYCLLDLKSQPCGQDLKAFIRLLESWMIDALKEMELAAFIKENMIGVWVKGPENQDLKIAAIGVRVRKWVTFHGMALNINPDLNHYAPIIPCGISDYGITSLHQLGIHLTKEAVDKILFKTCPF